MQILEEVCATSVRLGLIQTQFAPSGWGWAPSKPRAGAGRETTQESVPVGGTD